MLELWAIYATMRTTWQARQVVGSWSACASSDRRRRCTPRAPQKLRTAKTLEQSGALGAITTLTSVSAGVLFGCNVDVIAGAPPPPKSGATQLLSAVAGQRSVPACSSRDWCRALFASGLAPTIEQRHGVPWHVPAKVDQLSAHDLEKKNV